MKKASLLKIVSILVSIVGTYLLIKSPAFGLNAPSEYHRVVTFGSMDKDSYHIMQQSFIDAFPWSGSILLAVGSFYTFQFFSNKFTDLT